MAEFYKIVQLNKHIFPLVIISQYENMKFFLSQDNPLHIQSSVSPGVEVVSDPFAGTGSDNWKRSMSIALFARNKLGLVDSSLPIPDSTSSSFKSRWRCNEMVNSWILGALSKSIGKSVISNLAHQVWLVLEQRYGVSWKQIISLNGRCFGVILINDTYFYHFITIQMKNFVKGMHYSILVKVLQ